MENQFSNPHPQGRKTPRSYQLQWKINFPTLNRRVGKLPDAGIYDGKSIFQYQMVAPRPRSSHPPCPHFHSQVMRRSCASHAQVPVWSPCESGGIGYSELHNCCTFHLQSRAQRESGEIRCSKSPEGLHISFCKVMRNVRAVKSDAQNHWKGCTFYFVQSCAT